MQGEKLGPIAEKSREKLLIQLKNTHDQELPDSDNIPTMATADGKWDKVDANVPSEPDVLQIYY